MRVSESIAVCVRVSGPSPSVCLSRTFPNGNEVARVKLVARREQQPASYVGSKVKNPHILVVLVVFSFFVPRGRLSWLTSVLERT